MHRLVAALVIAFACGGTPVQHSDDSAEAEPRRSYAEIVAGVAAARERFAARLDRAESQPARARVLDDARAYLHSVLANELLPAWLGTPWAMNGVAERPGDAPIACGYFVATVLRDAGFVLDRVRFGQAAALRIQHATSPEQRPVHRVFSIPPNALSKRIAGLGPGVYLIGLDVHVGFVVVTEADVRFVHSSYTGARVVTDEALAAAVAIANSQPSGYFVSELATTDDAVVAWIEGRRASLPDT